MPELGVNIDHVATLRQARRTFEPDPVWAASLAELGGADAITVHLREDRRHIQDRDVRVLREVVTARLNLEMACVGDVLQLAAEIRPDQATLVPERRQEVTTEGGLDLLGNRETVTRCIDQLHECGIQVSLFLDPDLVQVDEAANVGADAVEMHTGSYALARGRQQQELEMNKLESAARRIHELGLGLHAGHGLNYRNVSRVARIAGMHELNIGHSIISRAVFVGLERAVREMKQCVRDVFRETGVP